LFLDNALLKGAKPSIGRQKPKMDVMVANCIKIYKGTYLRQFGDHSCR
jgi:hypothetical protein